MKKKDVSIRFLLYRVVLYLTFVGLVALFLGYKPLSGVYYNNLVDFVIGWAFVGYSAFLSLYIVREVLRDLRHPRKVNRDTNPSPS